MVSPATFARNSDSRTLPSRSGRMMATTSFISSSHPHVPGPASRVPRELWLSFRTRNPGRVGGGGSFRPPVEHQDRSLAAAVRLFAVLREIEPHPFFAGFRPQRHHEREELHDDERSDDAVD